MPRVLNRRRHGIPRGAVYVGRSTVWGNPYRTSSKCSRTQAVAKFRAYLMSRPELLARAKAELKGWDLVCWCAPEACHADVLLRVANG